MTESIVQPPGRRIVAATIFALVVAAAILVVAILPAEYGIDPLGTGRRLGLTALADVPEERPAVDAVKPGAAAPSSVYKEDAFSVELRPFEGMEYKYRLEQGAGLIYSWQASGKVEFEFHGEPDGAPAKYFDSYAKGAGTEASGTFVAAKAGIHGWYWKNSSAGRVTVTLKTAGFYSASTEYRDGERVQRTFAGR